jgi:hypothetical protein
MRITLETRRLLLRPVVGADAAEIGALLAEPAVFHFLCDGDAPFPRRRAPRAPGRSRRGEVGGHARSRDVDLLRDRTAFAVRGASPRQRADHARARGRALFRDRRQSNSPCMPAKSNAQSTSRQPGRCRTLCEPPGCRFTLHPMRFSAARTRPLCFCRRPPAHVCLPVHDRMLKGFIVLLPACGGGIAPPRGCGAVGARPGSGGKPLRLEPSGRRPELRPLFGPTRVHTGRVRPARVRTAPHLSLE